MTAPAAADAGSLDVLVQRAQTGDRAAAEAAFELLWPPAVAYAAALERRTGTSGGAEDIAQEALVTLFERLSEFDRERSALGWALSLVYWQWRTAGTKARRERARGVSMDLDAAPSVDPGADEALAAAEHLQLLETVTEGLDAHERRLLGLDSPLEMHRLAAPAALRKQKQRLIERMRSAYLELIR